MNQNSTTTWSQRALSWSQDQAITGIDRQLLTQMISDKAEKTQKQLTEMFYQELEFGTAGLRGIVGLGSNRMNIYNIRKASHALALTIKKHFNGQPQKVAISFDSRLTSNEFARTTAEVLSAHGIKCSLANRPTATPLLSYAVRYLECCAGVMVTASHNPKDYNGYKVYWSDGSQITPPIDNEIISCYQNINSFSEIPTYNPKAHLAWDYFHENLYQTYYQKLEDSCLRVHLCKNQGQNLKVVYTPLHGTGLEPVKTIFAKLGFSDFHVVDEQAEPNGNFPTTTYPNPEDPKALYLARDLMLKIKADVAIGSDPDTDRMGVIVNLPNGVKFLSGNEIASFLLYYKLMTLQEQKKLTPNSLVIKSIVTSTLQEKICQKFGVKLQNTLTGFKWMAEVLRSKEDKKEIFDFVFASEESFGTMPNCFVRDKDGVAAAILLCEALLYFKSKNLNYSQVEQKLNDDFGYNHDIVLNYQFPGIHGMKQMKLLMEKLSHGAIPSELGLTLSALENYAERKRKDFSTSQITALSLPKTSMLGLIFNNNSKIYIRPSGTEPKIKFYLLLQGFDKNHMDQLTQKITKWIESEVKMLESVQ